MATPLGLSDALLDGFIGQFYRETDGVRDLLSSVSSDGTLFQLPQIVVVGQESSGKSSVLESLAMLPLFPRDERICTRMPIHLKLRRQPEPSHQDADVDAPPQIMMRLVYSDARKPVDSVMTFTPDEIAQRMRQWMDDIVSRESQDAGKQRGVVDHVIEIHVSSPSVPTLDLIDLPGIVAGRLPGEPDNMMEQTRALVEKYLNMPHTLVLAVVPAGERIRNSQAFQLVQQYKLTDRTVGVLTMVDRAADVSNPSGPFADVIAKLEGSSSDVVELAPHGYVAVKSRDTRVNESDLLPLATFKAHETAWFTENIGGQYVKRGLASSGALALKVERMLVQHVKKEFVPSTQRQLRDKIKLLETQAKELGQPPKEITAKLLKGGEEAHQTFVTLFSECIQRAMVTVDAEALDLAQTVDRKLNDLNQTQHRSSLLADSKATSGLLVASIVRQEERLELVQGLVHEIVLSAVLRLTTLVREEIQSSNTSKQGGVRVERFSNLTLLVAKVLWTRAKALLEDKARLSDLLVGAMRQDDSFSHCVNLSLSVLGRDSRLASTTFIVAQVLFEEDPTLELTTVEDWLIPSIVSAKFFGRVSKQNFSSAAHEVPASSVFAGMMPSEAHNLLGHAAACVAGQDCENQRCKAVQSLVHHTAKQDHWTNIGCDDCSLLQALTRHHIHACEKWSTPEAASCTVCSWHKRVTPRSPTTKTPTISPQPVNLKSAFSVHVAGDQESRRSQKPQSAILPCPPTSSLRPASQTPIKSSENTSNKPDQQAPAPQSEPSTSFKFPMEDNDKSRKMRRLVAALSRHVIVPLVRDLVDTQVLTRLVTEYLATHPLSTTENRAHWFHETCHAQRVSLSETKQRLEAAMEGLTVLS